MRCKICDSVINKPVWNAELKDWEVCSPCLEIINNVFEDYPTIEDPYETEEVEEESS
jgi:tRNA G26 N,N-dimethylase Trm1